MKIYWVKPQGWDKYELARLIPTTRYWDIETEDGVVKELDTPTIRDCWYFFGSEIETDKLNTDLVIEVNLDDPNEW